jgi:replicative DNA helicase
MTDDFNFDQNTLSDAVTRPSNREAEEALIGAVLINQEVYLEVAQFLKAEDFFIDRNRWI